MASVIKIVNTASAPSRLKKVSKYVPAPMESQGVVLDKDFSNYKTLDDVITTLALAERRGCGRRYQPGLLLLAKLPFSPKSKIKDRFSTENLTRYLDVCSSLGLVDMRIMTSAFTVIQENNALNNREWQRCCLSHWSGCIWYGVPTLLDDGQIGELVAAIMRSERTDWSVVARLAWCVHNDSSTKHNLALVSELDSFISKTLYPVSIGELLKIVSLVGKGESGILVRMALDNLWSRKGEVLREIGREGRLDKSGISLLKAWIRERALPSDQKFVTRIVRAYGEQGICPEVVLDLLATFEGATTYFPATPEWQRECRSYLFKGHYSLDDSICDQLSSLALSAAALKFTDVEACGYMACLLNKLLVEKKHRQQPQDALWKFGAWYAAIMSKGGRNGETIQQSALRIRYPELCGMIASGMWDRTGAFVKPVEMTESADRFKSTPTERVMKLAITNSLKSIGITCVPLVHVPNTPYSLDLYIPDRNVGLCFLRPGEDLLSDSSVVTGQTRLMTEIVRANNYKVELVNVHEWERNYLSMSQEDFLSALLGLIDTQCDESLI